MRGLPHTPLSTPPRHSDTRMPPSRAEGFKGRAPVFEAGRAERGPAQTPDGGAGGPFADTEVLRRLFEVYAGGGGGLDGKAFAKLMRDAGASARAPRTRHGAVCMRATRGAPVSTGVAACALYDPHVVHRRLHGTAAQAPPPTGSF